ncbi:MAG TPA: outer membrane beta-barrel protein, partial [Candidatus Deferrimicrobiaceae bacterium]|nr:outer membrane beta-barrel protein [Candidatus Deferrimicrobiaceae bacterium]
MRRACTVQVLLMSTFVLTLAGRTGAQATPDIVSSSANRSDTDQRTEQQEMRDELKALREEVERLRLEVEHNKSAETGGEHVAAAPATPVKTGAPSGGLVVKAPAISIVPSGTSSEQPTQLAVAVAPSSEPTKTLKIAPFSDWDWTWLNGNPRTKEAAFDSKFFTPEIRADVTYTYDFNKPVDNTISGSSEIFRSNEIQLEQLGIGGDFHYDNVRARFMTQFGMYSETTPRNDPSPAKGQWDLDTAYRYLAEAYGGYHFNALDGINVDAGIFLSYIGLFSYYNFDNWAYQPSYVSSNT